MQSLKAVSVYKVQEEERRTLHEGHEAELTAMLQEKDKAALLEKKALEKHIASLSEQLDLLQQKLRSAQEASCCRISMHWPKK